MSPFETYFLQTTKWLTENDFTFFLHGSTLLRALRDKTVEPRADVIHDKELNFGILAEDFTDRHYYLLQRAFPYFFPIHGKLPHALIFFAQDALDHTRLMNDHWSIKPGFTLLARYFKNGNQRVEYMGDTHYLTFPAELFEKDTWQDIELLGNTYKGLSNAYLTYYFGDWQTEKKDWHWSGASALREWNDFDFKEVSINDR